MIKAGFFNNLTEDNVAGVTLIANICETPFRTIVSNTGISPDIIADKLKQNWAETKTFSVDMNLLSTLSEEEIKDFFDNLKNKQHNNNEYIKNKFKFGYNAAKQKYEDLILEGVIDPAKVSKLALSHAVSVIGLMLTCNAVIVNEDLIEE